MTTLPSGTVTFVFSDIEGSTTLLKQLGERYDGVLSEHRRLMRESFIERGGVEIEGATSPAATSEAAEPHVPAPPPPPVPGEPADFGARLAEQIEARVRRSVEQSLERAASQVDALAERAAERPDRIAEKLEDD